VYALLYAALPLFVGTASVFAQSANGAVSTEVLKDLAPSGKLRAAINLGNSVLAQTDARTGQPKGVTPDLACELGRRLGVASLRLYYRPTVGARAPSYRSQAAAC